MRQRLWTDESSSKLLKLVRQYHMKWSLIEDEFPDLTVTQLKNKYYKLINKPPNESSNESSSNIQRQHKLTCAVEDRNVRAEDLQISQCIELIYNLLAK